MCGDEKGEDDILRDLKNKMKNSNNIDEIMRF